MWDLNDSPDQRKDYESEGCSSSLNDDKGDKGKRVGSVSNSSSSAVVLEDGWEEEDSDRGGSRTLEKKSSKIFGFSVTHDDSDHPPVTRQFFPVEDSDLPDSETAAAAGGSSSFPRAHWVGVKFCQSEALGAGKSVKVSEPMKKSRRGPRSRSSQYRGVTFYRRTGRWESHIWLVLCEFIQKKNLTISQRCDIDSFGCGCPWWCRDCGKQVYLGKYYMGRIAYVVVFFVVHCVHILLCFFFNNVLLWIRIGRQTRVYCGGNFKG